MTPSSYLYTMNEQPLSTCPRCGHVLTNHDGIILVVSIGGKVFEHLTRLTHSGELVDTCDKAVQNGFHSETRCGGCNGLFIDMEAVSEIGQFPDENENPYVSQWETDNF